jgi:hypothetical protein
MKRFIDVDGEARDLPTRQVDTRHVGAYYFPGFHVDPRNERWHGPGWTEWELLKRAEPRFEGHRQPRVPVWGHFDEADERVARDQVALAQANGVTAFIFDWYWYDGGPFLNRPLDDAFIPATADGRTKIALMWANHDWLNIHPAKAHGESEVLLSGMTSAQDFDGLAEHVIHKYFTLPQYLQFDGGPYFSIYDIATFVAGMGGTEGARSALDRFREKAVAAGVGRPHLNVIVTDSGILPGERTLEDARSTAAELGADSTTSYVWIHHYEPSTHGFPQGSYSEAAQANQDVWRRHRETPGPRYHPNVTVGWDASPRTVQSETFENRGYPWNAVLDGATPEAFENALSSAREYVGTGDPGDTMITINAWNEWTEGSYLLPDMTYGLRYLEAIRNVFARPEE